MARTWIALALGNMVVVEAATKAEARRLARELAPSCSALPSDVSEPRPATEDEIAWYRAMGGAL